MSTEILNACYRFAVFCCALIPGLFVPSLAQEAPPGWHLMDPAADQVQGLSIEKAYQTLLKGRPARSVIVAIVDSGVDINHEDLKGVVWTNPGEIAGNGLDDDHNGYIDDVNGWNFIGGKDGNVNDDTFELTREYVRLKKKYGTQSEKSIPKKERRDYALYKDYETKFEKGKAKDTEQFELFKKEYNLYVNLSKNLRESIDTLKVVMQNDKLTPDDVAQLQTTDPNLLFAKGLIARMLKNTGDTDIDTLALTLEESVAYFKEGYDEYASRVEYGYNESFDPRPVVGDDYNNPHEKIYGNNDVIGPDAKHGTHVAGIIAADRNNNLGVMGIADHVQIMTVRMVPNGDERDKDVANAIRYAVDNGAKIINMSFGKAFSPQKSVVDEAVRYAEQHGVVLVHAAGNESEDTDEKKEYPSRYYQDGKEAKNWLEVGASKWSPDETLVANFSNYGKKSVDVFSPGVDIYSTTPGDTYESLSGTSMAAPTAAGVAAILMSYFPELTDLQVIDILKKSTRKFDGLKVEKPGGGKAEFGSLSNTGGLVNAYDAIALAIQYKGRPPEK